jgi:hypothetical protein
MIVFKPVVTQRWCHAIQWHMKCLVDALFIADSLLNFHEYIHIPVVTVRTTRCNINLAGQCTYNVTLRSVRATIVAVENQ